MSFKQYTALDIPSVCDINRIPKRWTAISTFSGCGGASLGLRMANYKVLYANEFIPSAAAVYTANKSPGTKLDTRDIRTVKPEEILRKFGMRRGELDYFDSSPPCKMYSSAARFSRIGKDASGVVRYSDWVNQRVDDLFDEFLRLRDGLMPKIFVAENVPGMTQSISQGFFLDILKRMGKGYRVKACIIDPSLLGVPQVRKRLVFIGVRNDLGVDPVFPVPYTSPPLGVRDVCPKIYQVGTGKAEWRDARLPGPVLTVIAARADEMSAMSASGFVKTLDGDARKLTIPELTRYFGFPSDFKLEGVMVPNKKGILNPATFEQSWERLARTHVPLQVYNIAATLTERILVPYYSRKHLG